MDTAARMFITHRRSFVARLVPPVKLNGPPKETIRAAAQIERKGGRGTCVTRKRTARTRVAPRADAKVGTKIDRMGSGSSGAVGLAKLTIYFSPAKRVKR